jgi:hypothetical protein
MNRKHKTGWSHTQGALERRIIRALR